MSDTAIIPDLPENLSKLTKAELIELVGAFAAAGDALAAGPDPAEDAPAAHLDHELFDDADMRRRTLLRSIPTAWADPPPRMIGKLPRGKRRGSPKGVCKPRSQGGDAPDDQDHFCGGWHTLPAIHLDYMGHADVTEALIRIDPEFTYTPGWNTTAGPLGPFALTDQRNPKNILLEMTLFGVTRPCVGTIEGDVNDPLKELLSDGLRNGAMRFGIAVRLWSKADHHDVVDESEPAPRPQAAAQPAQGPQVAPERPPLPEGTMTVPQAKRRILDVVGDTDDAKACWADLTEGEDPDVPVFVDRVGTEDVELVNAHDVEAAVALIAPPSADTPDGDGGPQTYAEDDPGRPFESGALADTPIPDGDTLEGVDPETGEVAP